MSHLLKKNSNTFFKHKRKFTPYIALHWDIVVYKIFTFSPVNIKCLANGHTIHFVKFPAMLSTISYFSLKR